MDFTVISGKIGVIDACGTTFDCSLWGPLLIAIDANQFNIAKYFLEDIMLNPRIFLVKPVSNEEKEVEQLLKRS